MVAALALLLVGCRITREQLEVLEFQPEGSVSREDFHLLSKMFFFSGGAELRASMFV